MFGLVLGQPIAISHIRRCGEKPTGIQKRYEFCWMLAAASGHFELDGVPRPNVLGANVMGATLVTRDGRAESLTVYLQAWNFEQIQAALVSAYGPPDRALHLIVERRRRYYTAQQLHWKGRQADIDVMERSPGNDSTVVTFRMPGDQPPTADEMRQQENRIAAWRPRQPTAAAQCEKQVPYDEAAAPRMEPVPGDLAAALASAQELKNRKGWDRVAASVQERVLRGQQLEVLLVLDDPDVRSFVPGKTPDDWVNVGGNVHYPAHRVALDAYKETMFPNGKWGNVTRVGDLEGPAVVVRIPDSASLMQLLDHPKVRCLREVDRRMGPIPPA
jgi:hypothetical protein